MDGLLLGMYSRLKAIVKEMAEKKGIKMTSFQEDRVRAIERKLDNSEISIDDAVAALEGEFGYNFSKYDYKEIKRNISGR